MESSFLVFGVSEFSKNSLVSFTVATHHGGAPGGKPGPPVPGDLWKAPRMGLVIPATHTGHCGACSRDLAIGHTTSYSKQRVVERCWMLLAAPRDSDTSDNS